MRTTATQVLLLLLLLLPAGCVSPGAEISAQDQDFAFVDLQFQG